MPKHFKRLREIAHELGDAPADYFISAGLDYKGQLQLAYTANGFGVSSEVSIDPGKIIGLKAEVGISGSVSRASEVLVVAMRGPAKVAKPAGGVITNPRPLNLNCLQGVFWEGAIGASLEVGVGFSAGVTSNSDKTEAKVENSFQDDDSKPSYCEGWALGFEAKAGFGASVGYKYHHFYAEDIAPQYFDGGAAASEEGKTELRESLNLIFAHGNQKAAMKKGACKFINAHPHEFGSISYDTTFGHTSSDEIIKKLRAGMSNCKLGTPRGSRLSLTAQNWIGQLTPWASNYQQSGLCHLRITSHNPSAEAGFKASVEVKASAGPIGGVGAKVGVKGPTVEIQGKWAYARYQTYAKTDPMVMCTQQTAIRYLAFDFTLLALQAEASATSPILGEGVSSDDTEEGKEWKEGKGAKWQLNRMAYTGTTLYWPKPEPLTSTTDKEDELRVPCLPGSGLAYGQSCVIENLWDLVTSYDSVMEEFTSTTKSWYAGRLAYSLGIRKKQLMEFLAHLPVYNLLKDLRSQDEAVEEAMKNLGGKAYDEAKRKGPAALAKFKESVGKHFGRKWLERSVLVEASFALPNDYNVLVTRKRVFTGGILRKKMCSDYFVVSSDVHKAIEEVEELNNVDKRTASLQAMRIRFRIQDVKNDDKARFPLGFKVAGTGAKVSLNEIERAGSEGVVDLATVWYTAGRMLATTSTPEQYEEGVPPVILFCQ